MKRDPNAVARDHANAAVDAFRPPDQMRGPRPAATGSRAKRKDHLNVADNTRSEEQPIAKTGDGRAPDEVAPIAGDYTNDNQIHARP